LFFVNEQENKTFLFSLFLPCSPKHENSIYFRRRNRPNKQRIQNVPLPLDASPSYKNAEKKNQTNEKLLIHTTEQQRSKENQTVLLRSPIQKTSTAFSQKNKHARTDTRMASSMRWRRRRYNAKQATVNISLKMNRKRHKLIDGHKTKVGALKTPHLQIKKHKYTTLPKPERGNNEFIFLQLYAVLAELIKEQFWN
jgi:hypothetical protein